MSSLFKKAKEKGSEKAEKGTAKEIVVIPDSIFHLNLSRLAELNTKIDEMSAEAAALAGSVKEKCISAFSKLYNDTAKYPGSFIIRSTAPKGKNITASLMFIPTDKYIKIGKERFEELASLFGADIVEETTTYTMDAELIDKYGDTISELIEKCKAIPQADKEKLIKATTAYSVKKGTITKLPELPGTISELLEEIKPVYQLKNVKIDTPVVTE